MSTNKWYWIIQTVGWTIYGMIGFTINAMFIRNNGPSILLPFISAGIMLLSTHGIRHYLKASGLLLMKPFQLSLRLVPMVVVLSMIINAFASAYLVSTTENFSWKDLSFRVYLLYVLQTSIYFSLWLGIYLVVYYFKNYKKQEIEKWKLKNALNEAELIALKAQVNPHFLFNALNNIRSLILEDTQKARKMMAHLAHLLRYSFEFNNLETVKVSDEIEIVKNYLQLSSIHFENRLSYSIEVGEDVEEISIPPMVIQLLVENAIKHGIAHNKKGGEIRVRTTQNNKKLVINVQNTGELKENAGKKGVGIKNALERIKLISKRTPQFSLTQKEQVVEAQITIHL